MSTSTWSFGRLIGVSIATLAVICVVASVLTYFQGPRIHVVDTSPATEAPYAPWQSVSIAMNQPIESVTPSMVSVEPDVPRTVRSNGKTVLVEFQRKLRYDTTYTIRLHGVKNPRQSHVSATVAATFHTKQPTVYYVRHTAGRESADKAPDTVHKQSFGDTQDSVLFSARKITNIVAAGNYIVASTQDVDKTSGLVVYDTQSKRTRSVALPFKGYLLNLHGSPSGAYAGFTLSSASNNASSPQLFSINLDTLATTPVKGFDNKQVEALDWQYSPDGSVLLVWMSDKTMVAIDAQGNQQPLPYGHISQLESISYDGTKVIASDQSGTFMLDLKAHRRSPIAGGDQGPGALMKVIFANNGDGQLATYYSDEGGDFTTTLYANVPGASAPMYQVQGSTARIANAFLSPNDQYGIIEQYRYTPDDIDANAAWTREYLTTQSAIIDVASGRTVRQINGMNVIMR